MNRHDGNRTDADGVTSPAVSRVLLLGFLVAGGIGLAAGVAWIAWAILTR